MPFNIHIGESVGMRLNPALQGDAAEAAPPSLPRGVSSGKIGCSSGIAGMKKLSGK
jgi:hypothetical protein